MVNRDELAICKRRGHDLGIAFDQKWKQCKWCGMWLRQVHTIEEREDEPPADEQSPSARFLGGR
jgi:hypothetical protein